jgi:hypothetical protein
VQDQPVGVLLDDLDRPGAAGGVAQPFGEGAGEPVRALEGLPHPVQGGRLLAADDARLEGHQTDQQGLQVVLVGEHQHRPAGAGHVAADLHRPGGLAQALRSTDEDQLTGAEAAAQVHVQDVKTGRPDPRLGVRARAHPVVGLLQHATEGFQR